MRKFTIIDDFNEIPPLASRLKKEFLPQRIEGRLHNKLWKVIRSKGFEKSDLCAICDRLSEYAEDSHYDQEEYGGFVRPHSGEIVEMDIDSKKLPNDVYELDFTAEDMRKIKKNGGIMWHSHPLTSHHSVSDRKYVAMHDEVIDLSIVAGPDSDLNSSHYTIGKTHKCKEMSGFERAEVPIGTTWCIDAPIFLNLESPPTTYDEKVTNCGRMHMV